MRVALLLDRFPATSETFIATAATGLVEVGCELSILARRRPAAEEPEHPGDDDLRRLTEYVYDQFDVDSLAPVPLASLAPGRHDVLHAHFGTNAQRWLFAREQAAAPLVVTFHGHDFSADPRIHGADMYRRLWAVADVVTYNCEHARRALVRLGCPDEKLRAHRMSVDVGTLAFRPRRWVSGERLRLLTVARLVDKKGYDCALRAIAARRHELPLLGYDIVGDGPRAEHLAELARELEVDDLVRFHGARGGAYVRRLLGEAHLFLLPSRTAASGDAEGAPVSLMEAQACGLPVVSSLHGGIPEVVVDGVTGVLVAENDADAFGDALVRVVADHESWPAMGGAGRAHVEASYDVAVCTEQLLAIYEDAIRSMRRPGVTVG